MVEFWNKKDNRLPSLQIYRIGILVKDDKLFATQLSQHIFVNSASMMLSGSRGQPYAIDKSARKSQMRRSDPFMITRLHAGNFKDCVVPVNKVETYSVT
jgi:hypothetical protein